MLPHVASSKKDICRAHALAHCFLPTLQFIQLMKSFILHELASNSFRFFPFFHLVCWILGFSMFGSLVFWKSGCLWNYSSHVNISPFSFLI